MRCRTLLASILILMTASFVIAQDKPKAPKPPAVFVGEMHVQTYPALNYLYGSAQTTFDQMMEVIEKNLTPIEKAGEEGKLAITGPVMFVYKGIKEDVSKPFTLEIGAVVSDNAKTFGEFKLRKTEKFKAATILFVGPVMRIGEAYEKLMPAVAKAGHEMTGENREFYLYWEGPDSPNNIVQIQVGIK